MKQDDHIAAEARTAEARAAAEWAARLAGAPGEADWLAFEDWLNAAPGRRAAYDRALGLSLEIDRRREALAEALSEALAEAPPAAGPASRLDRSGRRPALWWGAALMGVAAAAVTFAALHPRPAPQATVYATGRGERRQITLVDGTRVALNAESRLSASLDGGRRDIVLAAGEAAFQVVHDPARPFTVRVGDRVLRDIGTEFDVVRHDGRIAVTVREGMVAVQVAGDEARSLTLGPGGRLEHREGSSQSTVLAIDADDAFSWRTGRLIYRGRPLAEVAADLNRYGDDEIRVADSAAGLRFSGVLAIDDQAAMVDRLTKLLPLSAARGRDGVIRLSELNSTR